MQAQKGKNIRGKLSKFLGTMGHAIIKLSADLVMLYSVSWIMGSVNSVSCTYLRHNLSVLLTESCQ